MSSFKQSISLELADEFAPHISKESFWQMSSILSPKNTVMKCYLPACFEAFITLFSCDLSTVPVSKSSPSLTKLSALSAHKPICQPSHQEMERFSHSFLGVNLKNSVLIPHFLSGATSSSHTQVFPGGFSNHHLSFPLGIMICAVVGTWPKTSYRSPTLGFFFP